ncbi:hypothetical protein [Rhodococcus koreensis]
MIRLLRIALAALVVAAGFTAVTAGAAAASPCVGKYDIVVGGFVFQGPQDSNGFQGSVDQRVGYNSYSTRGGVSELNRLARDHRKECPGDHIHAVGHSGGAAVVHVWAKENGNIGNASIVLLADPKRPAGPGGPGFAATDPPFNLYPPLAGADGNYGGLPAMQVCNGTIGGGDHICNSQVGWGGYNSGVHGQYDFNVDHWPINANGQIYR